MTTATYTLITGANGEVGHGLIRHLAPTTRLIALDRQPLDADLLPLVHTAIAGDILDDALLARLERDYRFQAIYHMAALLSTSAERDPARAHDVNVNGTVKLLELARRQSEAGGEAVKVLFPSSIAVYGLPDVRTKAAAGALGEDAYLTPTTMYGCNKLYCEHLGRYYAQHYGQFAPVVPQGVDFRALRLPGLISAFTLPTGGTSDYGPEMIHAAVQGQPYACFVRPDTTIPFMTMPDAVAALTQLAQAPRARLTRTVYNVTSFSLSAADFAARVRSDYPDAAITFAPHAGRQAIVDSWCADLDDSAARADWGWQPVHDARAAFDAYIMPNVRARYADAQQV